MKCRHTLAMLAIVPVFLVAAAAAAPTTPAATTPVPSTLVPSAPAQAAPASNMPSVLAQEMIIKQAILTLNDANLTNNYTVFYARASIPLQKETSPEKMAEAFKSIRDSKARLGGVVVNPVAPKIAEMMPNGLLHLAGDVTNILSYDLKFVPEGGNWALIDISIGAPSKK